MNITSAALGRAPRVAFLLVLFAVPVAPGGAFAERGAAVSGWAPGAWRRLPVDPPYLTCPRPTRVGLPRDREPIRRHIRGHLPQIRRCFQQGTKRRPDLSGRIEVRLRIAPSGEVADASVVSSTMGDEGVERCVAERARTWRFPAFGDGLVRRVHYPWTFEREAAPARRPPGLSPRRLADFVSAAARPGTDKLGGARDKDLAALVDAIRVQERRLARLPEGDEGRREALRRLGPLYVALADRILVIGFEGTEALYDGLLRAHDAGADALAGRLDAVLDEGSRRHRAALRRAAAYYEQLRDAFSAETDAATSLFLAGLLLWEAGAEAEAEAEPRLLRLIASHPDSVHVAIARFLLAEQRFAAGNYVEALAAFEPLRAHEDVFLAAHASYRVAWCHYVTDRHEEAIAAFAAAIRAPAGAPEQESDLAWLRRAAAREVVLPVAEVVRPEDAVERLREAGAGPEGAAELARRWFETGRCAEAIALTHLLLEGSPVDPAVLELARKAAHCAQWLDTGAPLVPEVARLLRALGELRAAGDEEAWTAERAASAKLVLALATTLHAEMRDTADAARADEVRALCELYLAHFADLPEAREVRHFLALFLLHRGTDPAAAAARLEEALAGERDARRVTELLEELVRSRQRDLACAGGEPAPPAPDDLVERALSPLRRAAIDAVERYARYLEGLRTAGRPTARLPGLAEERLLAARWLYDHNRFAEAIPRLEALVADEGAGEVREEALALLLSAAQLACDLPRLRRWREALPPVHEGEGSDLSVTLRWLRSHDGELEARCAR